MSNQQLPWGPLGSPTKEQIQAFKDLPYGKFKEMIKASKSKKKKLDPEYDYQVTVTKRVTRTDLHNATISIRAKDGRQAISLAEIYKPESIGFTPGLQNLEKITYEYQAVRKTNG